MQKPTSDFMVDGGSVRPRTPRRRRLPAILTLAAFGLLFASASCSPGARSANCRNDGDCQIGEDERSYCVHSRCVECVTNSGCGARQRCAAGECVARS